jgi:hypothetical protein
MSYRPWESPFPSLCIAFSCWFSKTCRVNTFTGSVSTVTLPLIITSVITLVNQTSTLYASCSSLSNLIVTAAISTISQSTMTPPQSSSTPATDTRTTVHTPEISGIVSSINSTPTVIPTFTSQSQTSDIAPILGGTLGGFFSLIGVVAITWFIRCIYATRSRTKSHTYIFVFARKKCRKSNAAVDERDIVIPFPVTRGRNQSRQLDLANESRPSESGFLGRSTQMTGPGSPPL